MHALVVALALAAAPAGKPAVASPKKDSTVKALLKDVGTSTGPGDEDGGVALINGLDVGAMPFTPDSIKQVVVSYQPRVQACHEEAMAGAKPLEGTVKIAFVITGDGYVKKAKVDKRGSTLKDAALHDCIVTVVSSMVFPKPGDRADHPVEFPFNLKPVE